LDATASASSLYFIEIRNSGDDDDNYEGGGPPAVEVYHYHHAPSPFAALPAGIDVDNIHASKHSTTPSVFAKPRRDER
jgi:hypothetical protein